MLPHQCIQLLSEQDKILRKSLKAFVVLLYCSEVSVLQADGALFSCLKRWENTQRYLHVSAFVSAVPL